MEVVVTTGAIRCAKLYSKCHNSKPTPSFVTGRMLFLSPNQQCQSNATKYIKYIILIHNYLTAFKNIQVF